MFFIIVFYCLEFIYFVACSGLCIAFCTVFFNIVQYGGNFATGTIKLTYLLRSCMHNCILFVRFVEFRAAFDLFDQDGNNAISKEELGTVMRPLSQ